jgi:hypothetical protein
MKKHTVTVKPNRFFAMPGVFFSLLFLALAGAFLLGGCFNPVLSKPEAAGGQGLIRISLTGEGVDPSLGERTLLPLNPAFTKYELITTTADGIPNSLDNPGDGSGYLEPYAFYNSTIQLPIPDNGFYWFAVLGYAGDAVTAKSGHTPFTVASGAPVSYTLEFILKNYIDPEKNGELGFSLSWDSLSRMPARAELLILKNYTVLPDGTPEGEPLPISEISNQGFTPGSEPGTVKLLQKDIAFISLTGSFSLPPGQYWLSMSVMMDEGTTPVKRGKLAHVYSNVNTHGAFHYGGGDLLVFNTSADPGAGFITGFTFTEAPNADTVIGSVAGTDGTRQIMVMIPAKLNNDDDIDLRKLTPVVETAEGASITSPLPSEAPKPGEPYRYDSMDFSGPVVWTAQSKNGTVQKYTVVVSMAPDNSPEKRITNFSFKESPNAAVNIYDGNKDDGGGNITDGSIQVIVPYGTLPANSSDFTPIVMIIGKEVFYDPLGTPARPDGSTSVDFSSDPIFRVYAGNGTYRDYKVTVKESPDTAAEITKFVIDGFPDRPGVIGDSQPDNFSPITVTLPYGVPLTNLKPLVQYEGKTLTPASGELRNFSLPVIYTVEADNPLIFRKYKVTVTTETADTDAGIFDFVITNVPTAKVVIGTKPRQDGKVPIVVQVPYAVPPLTAIADGSKTDLTKLIPKITLSSENSVFVDESGNEISPPNGTSDVIPFNNQGDYQEAVYRIKAQDGTIRDYVVVVARDVRYYYVKATGDDTDPDQYNGGSESTPFKTLAYAVYQAVEHRVDHIYVTGTLNDTSEGGAWEDTSTAMVENSGTFEQSGAPVAGGGSVFNLKGSGMEDGSKPWRITITGVSNAVLQGVSGKRVLSVTGGADLVFEDITFTGGNTGADGGGVYVGGSGKVKFSNCTITGNTAKSGGGVFIEGSDAASDSVVTLMGGTISGNTAIGSATALDSMGGGGGVYIKGNALFWLSSGTIVNNTASHGAGGGVLVNGNPSHDPDGAGPETSHEDGFLMSSGSISGNKAPGGIYPHGGGGVYVAMGAFEMLGGEITGNTTNRQGGGVFIHWGNDNYQPHFTASGFSSVTGNTGVGSSAAICNRGITAMAGNAQADKIYVWNYDRDPGENTLPQSFTLAQNARASGIVLAYSAEKNNFITIAGTGVTGKDRIAIIDLEGRLTNGKLSGTIDSEWLDKKVIEVSSGEPLTDYIDRLPLGTFVGTATSSISASYKIEVDGTNGFLKKK